MESSGITRIIYRSPSAPYRVRGVQPTITRMFKEDRGSSIRVFKRSFKSAIKLDNSKTTNPSTSRLSPRERSSTPRSNGPNSSHQSSPTASPPGTPRLNRSATPVHTSDEPQNAATHKGKKPQRSPSSASLLRSSSRISSRSGHKPSQSESQPHPSVFRRRPPGPPDPGVPLWTCFGLKNGEPVYMRRTRISSTTDPDCLTAYWESFSLDTIRVPPDLSNKDDLQEGDLYCNSVHNTDVTQTWIWSKEGNHPAFWKAIEEGDTREDGRRLSITPKYKYPSWVKPEWCVKQMAKHSKNGSRM